MKKNLFIVLGLCSTLLITGCDANKEDNYSVYEWHAYDATFKHTEEFVAKYDDDGKLKYLETITAWDKEKNSSCNYANSQLPKYPDLQYKDVGFKCEELDNGGIRITYYMTDKSIEDGYLSEDSGEYRFDLEYIYPELKEEKLAKEIIQGLIDSSKEAGLEFNEQNYAVIDGVKTGW